MTKSHGCFCDGVYCLGGKEIIGECYKCADCLGRPHFTLVSRIYQFDSDGVLSSREEINYCLRCFIVDKSTHKDGSHRFLLLRNRSPRIIMQSILSAVKNQDSVEGAPVDFWKGAYIF